MKKSTLIMPLLAAIAIVFLTSCGPKTKKITVDNSKKMVVSGLSSEVGGGQITVSIHEDFNLYYDVELQLNGVDFGIIEGGSDPVTMEVPDANNLKVEKFNIVKNEKGLGVYDKTKNGEKVYMDFSDPAYAKMKDMEKCEADLSKIESAMKTVEQAGGLMNDSWSWDISYFENGNVLWNKSREAEKNKSNVTSSSSKKKKK